jgi:hypothetical protein
MLKKPKKVTETKLNSDLDNNTDNNTLLDINLPFNTKEEEVKKEKKLVTPTRVVVTLTAVVIVSVLGVALNLIQADKATPSKEIATGVTKPVSSGEDILTPEGSDLEDIKPFLEEDDVSSDTAPIKADPVSDGHALYENGLMRLRFEYPENWFVSETTSNALGSLPKGEFNIEKTKLTDVVPLANFFTSGNPAKSEVDAILMPRALFSKSKDVAQYFLKQEQKVSKVTGKSSAKYGNYKVSLTEYTLDDLGDTYTATQMSLVFGPNVLVINGRTSTTAKELDHHKIMENMISTLQLVKGGKLHESLKESDESEVVADNG